MTVGAVVLAAGRSQRMGRPKALLPCGDRTFLGAILATLSACPVETVRVVLGHGADEIRAAVPLPDQAGVQNDAWESGMLSSVCCGIRALPLDLDALLVWPVDHPLVTASTVTRLIELETVAGIRIPVHRGRRGHPVLFAARLRDAILRAPPATGLRAVAQDRPGEVVELPVEDPGVVVDVDTPADFDRWLGQRPT